MASASTHISMGTGVDLEVDKDGNVTIIGDRDLYQSGGSTVLTIPPKILDELDWELEDTIRLTAQRESDEVVLQKVDPDESDEE